MWQTDDFDLGRRVGTGNFGYVQLATEKTSKMVVALKAMKKRRVERMRVQRHVIHEIEIQAHLRHPNILQLFGFFWDASYIYMILEYASNGDLHSLLQKQPGRHFDEARVAGFAMQIISALAYCHQMHVIHRDLKPQNILVTSKAKLKLADFGWAVHTYPNERRWTLCGTLDYMPPEIVHAIHGHSFGVDVWSLGILTYELSSGQPPFVASTREETFRQILAATPVFAENFPVGIHDFVTKLLRRNPSDRLSLQAAAAHPWLKQHTSEDCAIGHGIAAFAGA